MEYEGSLRNSQVPATCPGPEPARSSPYPHIPLPDFRFYGTLLFITVNTDPPLEPGISQMNPVYTVK